MASNFDIRLGELALARGVATVRDLLECCRRDEEDERSLGELLAETRRIPAEDIRQLERELRDRDPDTLSAELDLGETLVSQTVHTGTARTLQQGPEDSTEGAASDRTMTLDLEDIEEISSGAIQDADVEPAESAPEEMGPAGDWKRYDFVDELGRGGMGQVLLARDRVMRRAIAVKTLLPAGERPDQSKERLLHEARLTGRLEHPSIVPTYDLGELENGEPYYTMRVVREKSLQQLLEERRSGEGGDSYSLTQLVSILRQVALALQYAHDKGVIHRDIKPENILIGAYGEVFIIDWGLAKVIDDRLSADSLDGLMDLEEGAILGTPRYMPPEQARGQHDEIDERSDVYSLGAVLYELLTLTPIFQADRTLMLLFKVVDEDPVPPSQVEGAREIPRELEEICLRAVAKHPKDRFSSAQALADELEMFLEGVKERERRERMAREAVEEADRARAHYESVREELSRLQDRLRQTKLDLHAWAPPGEKEELWELEQGVEDKQVDVERAFGEATQLYGQALGHQPDMPEARRALAELYWERFEEHESAGERARAAYFESLVRQYNDGQYDDLLKGKATFSLETSPGGVRAQLYEYEEVNRRRVEKRVADLGTSPVATRQLSNGSYVIELQKEGFSSMQVPMRLERLDSRELRVRMYRDAEIPEDFVVVTGGPYLSGGADPDSADQGLKELGDFAIQRHPVTCAEYLDFLNALAEDDMEEAHRRAPSHPDKPSSYFPLNKEGRFVIPSQDQDGDAWRPQWPICLITAFDAEAYARWRSRRDGHSYRLPTAEEWEKAARGVDGRLYPWGNHFDASFCKMDESTQGRSFPAAVGSFPVDRSPYGAMDMAGNILEWTSTVAEDEGGRRILQGANFRSIPLMCRLDWTSRRTPSEQSSNNGFRLVMDLEHGTGD